MPKKRRKLARKYLIRRLVLAAAALVLVVGIVYFAAVSIYLLKNDWGLTVGAVVTQSLPKKDRIKDPPKESTLIETGNRLEVQGDNQSGGFAAAFLLRHHGVELSGADAYGLITKKLSSGYVMPDGILRLLKENDIKYRLYKGSAQTLKARVSNGSPVVAIIGQGGQWQRYVTVVGYDNNNVYLFDSTEKISQGQIYNRAMSWEEFESLWNNGLPFYHHTYLAAP